MQQWSSARVNTRCPAARFAGVIALLLLSASTAHAIRYPADLSGVQTEEDLYEIFYDDLLDEQELDTLLALLEDPVDVNAADRDELFDLPELTMGTIEAILEERARNGRYDTLDDLTRVSFVTPEMVDQLRPFAEAAGTWAVGEIYKGNLDVRFGWNPEQDNVVDSQDGTQDDITPPSLQIRSRSKVIEYLDVGIIITESQELGELSYSPAVPVFRTDATQSEPEGTVTGSQPGYLTDGVSTHWDLAKIFIATPRLREPGVAGIVGSYRIGFGMGLVLDTTGRDFPDGWRPDLTMSANENLLSTSPVRYRDNPGFFGGAVSGHVAVGPRWMTGHAFVSRIDRNVFNTVGGLYICARDANGECTYRIDERNGDSIYKISSQTILDGFRETTAGANANFHLDGRTQIGVSGWWGTYEFLIPDGDEAPLMFSRSAKFPQDPDDSFGAVGGHVFWGVASNVDLRLEYARSHGNNDGGGNGAWLWTRWEPRPTSVELGLRYYDEHFENPHTSPYAQSDQLDGHRARDEMGVNWRISHKFYLVPVELRLKGDIWRRDFAQCTVIDETDPDDTPSEPDASCLSAGDELEEGETLALGDPVYNTDHELSAVYRPLRTLRITLRPRFTDKDLSESGRGTDFEDGTGSKFSLFAGVDYEALKWLKLKAGYRHAWTDDTGPRAYFDPSLYPGTLPEDYSRRTSTRVVDSGNPDCFDEDGVPLDVNVLGRAGCRALYDDGFRQDYYVFGEATARYGKTSFSTRIKINEEAIGYPSVVASSGSYWQLRLKLTQRKTLNLFSASLRYDLLRFTDERLRWYEERLDKPGELLLDRFNHQIIGTVKFWL